MDLQGLIAARRGTRSLQELADASGLTKQAWQTFVHPRVKGRGGLRVPNARSILGISRALDVDVETVLLSIGETLGVLPGDRQRPALLDALPPYTVLDLLTPDDVQTVVRLVSLLAGLRAEAATHAPLPAAQGRPRSRRARPRAVAAPVDDGDADPERHPESVGA